MAEELARQETERKGANEIALVRTLPLVDVELRVFTQLSRTHTVERSLQIGPTEATGGHAETMSLGDGELPAESIGKWGMNGHACSLAGSPGWSEWLSTA